MATVMSGICILPPEILDQIIGYVEAWRFDQLFLPQAPLTHLLRVCVLWHSIVERRLYQSISIGFDFRSIVVPEADRKLSVRKRRINGIVHELLETLRNNSRLTSLVRRLRLNVAEFRSCELSKHCVEILRLCVAVDSVHIHGYHPDDAAAFVDAIRPKCLTALIVSGRGRGGDVCGPLCSLPELLEIMAGWPHLQSVQFSNAALSPSKGHPVVTRKACTQLHTIDVPSGPRFSGHHLRALLSMCPIGVKKLHIMLCDDADSVAALCECLYAWASTLVDLRVAFPRVVYDSLSPSLSDVVSRLEILQRLHIVPVLIPSHSLANLPRLTELVIYSNRNEIDNFLSVLGDQNSFPSLRILKCILAFDSSGIDSSSLYGQTRNMCSTRGITFSMSTTRRIRRRTTIMHQ